MIQFFRIFIAWNYTIVDRIQSNNLTVQKGLYFRYSLLWKGLFLTNQTEILRNPFWVSLILLIGLLFIKFQDFLELGINLFRFAISLLFTFLAFLLCL